MDVMRNTMYSGITSFCVVYNGSIRIKSFFRNSASNMTFTPDGVKFSDDYGNERFIHYDKFGKINGTKLFFNFEWVPHS